MHVLLVPALYECANFRPNPCAPARTVTHATHPQGATYGLPSIHWEDVSVPHADSPVFKSATAAINPPSSEGDGVEVVRVLTLGIQSNCVLTSHRGH